LPQERVGEIAQEDAVGWFHFQKQFELGRGLVLGPNFRPRPQGFVSVKPLYGMLLHF
jgi:hypothetical protein